ncbi:MAG TPA: dihydrolipoamide acetyltransferase family protein [Gemmatimonadaceae bacterium]|nr:dihydrolipoamide acetyltransferase family protein [Gemmatimonadaceae bacterium]
MARIDVVMPQMGESIAEGTLSRWLKKVGDAVKRDEPIFEISTDKVDAEIPAASNGILVEILVQEGQTVAVQTVVARLETDAAAAATAAPAQAPAPAAAAAVPATAAASPTAVPTPSPAPAPTPTPTRGSGNGNSFEERIRTKSSPLVRRMAAEQNVDISALQGSGIAGRVTRRDLAAYLESGGARVATPAPSMHAPAGVESHGPAPEAWAGDKVEPMSKIRKLTSDHMIASKREHAHVTSFFEIDLTRVARLRHRMRAQFEQQTGQKLTYLPFILKVVVDGLKQFPVLNSVVSGNNIIYRKRYNLGIAVALDWGLIVPVIKNADDLSLSGLTKALNDLAERARGKKLKPEEVQDATFSITNPGVFGSLMGTPIIPMGTSAILGLGAIEKRPKVITGPDGEDTIAIRTCAYFSLSFDHRIVDGSDADKFLAYLKKHLESYPDTTA